MSSSYPPDWAWPSPEEVNEWPGYAFFCRSRVVLCERRPALYSPCAASTIVYQTSAIDTIIHLHRQSIQSELLPTTAPFQIPKQPGHCSIGTLATNTDQNGYAQPGVSAQYAYPDPLELQAHTDHFLSTTAEPAASNAAAQAIVATPTKRKNPPSRISKKPDKRVRRVGPKPEASSKPANTSTGGDGEDGEASKPKRVRTGCLTCRERHLKCDEAWPHCQNCRKSNRTCKRGIKLNFIDTWFGEPTHLVTAFGTDRWKVDFLDESREIAAEYVDGEDKYPPLEQPITRDSIQAGQLADYPFVGSASHPPPPQAPQMKPEVLPSSIDGLVAYQQPDMNNMFDVQDLKQTGPPFYDVHSQHSQPAPHSGSSAHTAYTPSHNIQQAMSTFSDGSHDLSQEPRKEFLDTAEETLFMQVFVEEVGLWMDSMDPMKHFSRLLPFHALSEPMLLNAFLACGAKHLTLVNPAYSADQALHYYDTATRYLLKNLQNPNRNTVICATTAVILNVYEVMSERSMQRMNHIAGARALIKECGWNARSTGIGAACFWLNVGLEVLSCLHFNWQVAWKPEDWGLDMDLSRETQNGQEESWTHRMLYIVGMICQLRATAPRDILPDHRAEQARKQQRYEEWSRLRAMADTWNNNIPRTMHPMSYVYPHQTSSKSAFPEVWLVKRTTIVARLFYHTAMLLLAQINPYFRPSGDNEMAEMQRRHAQMTCGIVAHVKDRGVASVAIRSLAHAAEVLTDRREQEEVLEIFDKIHKETGWRIGFVYAELKEKWGWNEEPSPAQYAQTHEAAARAQEAQRAFQQQQQVAQAAQPSMQLQQSYDYHPNQSVSLATQALPTTTSLPSNTSSSSSTAKKKMPSGIPNPMYAKADFTLPQHPYQNFYVAPTAGFTTTTTTSQGGQVW